MSGSWRPDTTLWHEAEHGEGRHTQSVAYTDQRGTDVVGMCALSMARPTPLVYTPQAPPQCVAGTLTIREQFASPLSLLTSPQWLGPVRLPPERPRGVGSPRRWASFGPACGELGIGTLSAGDTPLVLHLWETMRSKWPCRAVWIRREPRGSSRSVSSAGMPTPRQGLTASLPRVSWSGTGMKNWLGGTDPAEWPLDARSQRRCYPLAGYGS